MTITIAIIGSRNWKDWHTFEKTMEEIKKGYTNTEGDLYVDFISGGARGIDTWAEEWNSKLSYPCKFKVIKAINPSDKFSYLLRNVEIIALSDVIYAFWDGESKGTKFVIDYATKRGKDIRVIRYPHTKRGKK